MSLKTAYFAMKNPFSLINCGNAALIINNQWNNLTAVSRILYRLAAAAIICLCDQNPEFITPRATTHSLFGLAAGGVYHAVKLSHSPGGLLPHPFTLTSGCPGAVCSLLHWSFRGISSTAPLFSKGLPALCSPDFPQREINFPPRLPAIKMFLLFNIIIFRRICKKISCKYSIYNFPNLFSASSGVIFHS